jgi:hypothetical protein
MPAGACYLAGGKPVVLSVPAIGLARTSRRANALRRDCECDNLGCCEADADKAGLIARSYRVRLSSVL